MISRPENTDRLSRLISRKSLNMVMVSVLPNLRGRAKKQLCQTFVSRIDAQQAPGTFVAVSPIISRNRKPLQDP